MLARNCKLNLQGGILVKNLFLAIMFLVSIQALASGPSTDEIVVTYKGNAVGDSEIQACEKARVNAYQNFDEAELMSEYTYAFTCDAQEDWDWRPTFIESSCSCLPTEEESTFDCSYVAKSTCLETVWYP